MIQELRRRKPEPTLLPTQRIFSLPHQIISMVWEELAFDDDVSYTVKCYSHDRDMYPSPQAYTSHALINWTNSPAAVKKEEPE